MLPLSALIILGAVGIFSTFTFLFAIYHTTKTKIAARRLIAAEMDNGMSLPLTEIAVPPDTTTGAQAPIQEATPSPPSVARPDTPEAEYPPPLPQDLDLELGPAETLPPLQFPMILPPKTPDGESSTPSTQRYETQADDSIRAETPPPLHLTNRDYVSRNKRDRDSTHEIYEIYSKLPPTPKSAPPRITTFAMAESKWAYFGQKRAEEMNMI
ncbi:uncharacterized protein Z520_06273 [Fonsecaea multimorphosa CBS 102226]|uniref:Uncharacterized protein n=1 Tax=Fonsecaea multimorphosa CBS 102226 TaxID=1442371 RepID=A0A0D2KN87_9EURO|nr:uncharacterized protein Z520_06273 [Fonsecaea multimorphosa CBS 102226]KIX98193.1 hypothetical protein Z520_06273 [Fonsecaea multimorphosa CBS 102226]